MDLSGSARTPEFPSVSAIFGCNKISRVYPSETVWVHLARTYHWGLERAWQFDTTWLMYRILTIPADLWGNMHHTHFGVPLGIVPGWWDDRKRHHKPVFHIYLHLYISNNLSRALSCLRLSGHNFLVQRMGHNRNRRPYELRICDKCDWHSVQDGWGTHFAGQSTQTCILLAFAHSTAS